MGQYYKALVVDREGTHVFEPSGLKLLEHGYYGDKTVEGVVAMLRDNPAQVGWIGDYADADEDFDGHYTQEHYLSCWGHRQEACELPSSPSASPRYLVDLVQREYVDLHRNREIALAKCPEGLEEWAVHPLPILTSKGNGRGGGDYHECFPNSYLAGQWALDVIIAVDSTGGFEEFADMTEVYVFAENTEA